MLSCARVLAGQSFDNDEWAIDGATDKYSLTANTETATTAQADGAIEGTHSDYLVSSPFSSDFVYSRFGTLAYKGRDITKLKGAKRRVKKLFADGKGPTAGASPLRASCLVQARPFDQPSTPALGSSRLSAPFHLGM